MTDRIAELRALRQAERDAHADGALLPWATAADLLRGALYDDCDALLDCAEALQRVQYDMKKFGCLTAETRRVVPEALARLNGDDHG